MNDKVMKFGYEDTDKKIEIDLYGLVFEIRNLENIEELEKVDRNDMNKLEAQIEKILGNGVIEKINNKRLSDGHEKLNLNIELNIVGCIMEAYIGSGFNGAIDRVEKTVNNINNMDNKFENREQKRMYKYNRGQYRNYKNYKNNYRRY